MQNIFLKTEILLVWLKRWNIERMNGGEWWLKKKAQRVSEK